MKRVVIAAFLLTFLPHLLKAQPYNLSLNRDYSAFVIGNTADTTYNLHSTIQPYLSSDHNYTDANLDSFQLNISGKVSDRLLNKDLIEKSGKFTFSADPILNTAYGVGKWNEYTDYSYQLGLGLAAKGSYGRRFAFGLDYSYNRASYMDYIGDFIRENEVIPGMGYAKGGDNAAYDNQIYSGYLSYSPDDIFNFQAGIGKQFIGNGYRSLLLSDNSFVHPYGQIRMKIWKIEYLVLYSNYKDVRNSNGVYSQFENKYSTTNYLSINVGRHANIGLFQSVVWQAKDSLHNRGYDVNYLNPVVFTRPIEYSVGSPDNALLGMNASYLFFKKYLLYGQFVLDEFLLDSIRSNNGWWANKFGYQLGLRASNLLGFRGLTAMAEYNYVRPYTYSHSEIVQNYGHYNQPLAHTLGANFREILFRLTYQRKRWLYQAHFMYAEQGRDYFIGTITGINQSNYGSDIYQSNNDLERVSGNYTLQGNLTRIQYLQCKTVYLINPKWHLMAEIGFTYRRAENLLPNVNENSMIFFGIKTALYNQYADF